MYSEYERNERFNELLELLQESTEELQRARLKYEQLLIQQTQEAQTQNPRTIEQCDGSGICCDEGCATN